MKLAYILISFLVGWIGAGLIFILNPYPKPTICTPSQDTEAIQQSIQQLSEKIDFCMQLSEVSVPNQQ